MNKRIRVLLIALIILLSVAPVFAEDGGHGHHFSWKQFLGKVLNSTILFGGLFYLLRKPIVDLLGQKSLDVKNDIILREEKLKNTTQELASLRERLKKIEEEVVAMREDAKKSGVIEKERLQQLGDAEAQRIKKITEEEIDTRVDNAVRNLKSKIADLTIQHFKADISNHLDDKAHKKIIDKNIQISGDIIERE